MQASELSLMQHSLCLLAEAFYRVVIPKIKAMGRRETTVVMAAFPKGIRWASWVAMMQAAITQKKAAGSLKKSLNSVVANLSSALNLLIPYRSRSKRRPLNLVSPHLNR
jgi:hypothetical protein